MGMTDRQFDAYQAIHLGSLKLVQEEIAEKGVKSEMLDTLIEIIEKHLAQP